MSNNIYATEALRHYHPDPECVQCWTETSDGEWLDEPHAGEWPDVNPSKGRWICSECHAAWSALDEWFCFGDAT